MSQIVPVRCCGDLRYVTDTDSFNCFILFQHKGFIMKFTGILFNLSEKLLTVKTA